MCLLIDSEKAGDKDQCVIESITLTNNLDNSNTIISLCIYTNPGKEQIFKKRLSVVVPGKVCKDWKTQTYKSVYDLAYEYLRTEVYKYCNPIDLKRK